MNLFGSFPIALITSIALHAGLLYGASKMYASFQGPAEVPVYFVDLVIEEKKGDVISPTSLDPIRPPAEDAHVEEKKQLSVPAKTSASPKVQTKKLEVPSKESRSGAAQGAMNETVQESKSENSVGFALDQQAIRSFQYSILKQLEIYKRYPPAARRRGEEGRGILRIVIARNGTLLEYSLSSSTGSALLDEELMELVKRATPFAPLPQDIPGESIAFKIPVSFKLQ